MLRVWRNVLARAKMKLDIGTLWNLLDTGCYLEMLLLKDHFLWDMGETCLVKSFKNET